MYLGDPTNEEALIDNKDGSCSDESSTSSCRFSLRSGSFANMSHKDHKKVLRRFFKRSNLTDIRLFNRAKTPSLLGT